MKAGEFAAITTAGTLASPVKHGIDTAVSVRLGMPSLT